MTAERIRGKVRASRMKGMWMGGCPPLGYEVKERKLVENPADAAHVRWVFARFIEIGSGTLLARELAERDVTTSRGHRIDKKFIYRMLSNRVYIGDAVHKGTSYWPRARCRDRGCRHQPTARRVPPARNRSRTWKVARAQDRNISETEACRALKASGGAGRRMRTRLSFGMWAVPLCTKTVPLDESSGAVRLEVGAG